MNDIEIFLNKRNHAAKSNKISVLEPHKDEIFQLKNMGYAEKIIVEFLAEMKGIKISRQALNQFIRSRSAQVQNNTTNQPTQPQKSVEVAQSTTMPESTQTEPQTTTPPKPQIKKGIKKFDWKNATTDGLI